MNEENKFGPKKSWTRIFRKKWFFPSVYLILAALLISAVVWYQNNGNDQEVVEEGQEQHSEDYSPIPSNEPAEPVMEQQEVVQLPVENMDDVQIVTKFFDYDADEAEQVNALIHYNNRYYQSTGVDIAAADGETFDVLAALSGTVSEVKEDPLLGNVVVIDHGQDVKTYYASLGEVSVEVDDSVKQGDTIGTAGKNNFGKDNGNHVHFEVRKGDTAVNPEAVFNQPLATVDNLVAASTEESEDPEEADDAENAEETSEPVEDEDSEEGEADSDDDASAEDEEDADEETEE